MKTRDVQAALLSLGYAVAIDGDFGSKTMIAVQAFQRGRGLAADGVVGPQTNRALQKATAEKPIAKPSVPIVPAPAMPGFAQPRETRRIDEIIIHCTATPEGRDVAVETIRSWHIGQGWKAIGYQWVVCAMVW